MRYFIPVALVIVLTAVACDNSGSTTPTTTTSPATTTITLSGTTPAALNGVPQSDTKPFSVGQSGGTVTLTLTAAVETLSSGTQNLSAVMGLGVGTPTGTTACTLLSGTTPALLQPGATSSISGTLSAGSYCIQVTNEDASAQSGPVAYTVVILTP